MSFEVRVEYPFGDDFVERDAELVDLVGQSDWGGAGFGARDNGYVRQTFAEAISVKDAILVVHPEYGVTVREV